MACSYYYIVSFEGITNQTWTPPFTFNDTLTDKYVGAFYFAIMVTTANDLGPQNTLERVFTGLMLLIGIGINASIIGSAANLLANMDKTEVARKEHLDAINDYLRFKKVHRVMSLYNEKIVMNLDSYTVARQNSPLLRLYLDDTTK
jgi:hypothetical protein